VAVTRPPLDGLEIAVLGVNAPALVAGARLTGLGASVTRIEPPAGDPVERAAPGWYAEATAGQAVVRVDLKDDGGRAAADAVLARVDGLLTAMRPAALERLGYGEEALSERFPDLVQVAIVGFQTPRQNVAGHDLTYAAGLGLLDPPSLPKVLVADLAGAERAVSTLLALLLDRGRTGSARFAEVSLAEAAEAFAVSYRHGATAPGGQAGGGDPLYGLYEAADGWIAVAALEPHFRTRLLGELGLSGEDAVALAEVFRGREAREWQTWAEEHDLPIAAVER
jgi:crotonobetainyl-CoA:carnitine CoA-transferase CaiB-like acyl-CoA transferase